MGGISKQPAHLRLPTQVADAENAQFTAAWGISKRPGTRYMTNVGTTRIWFPADITGTFAVGDTITQGGTTGTVISVQQETISTVVNTWLTVQAGSGTFSASGTIFGPSGTGTGVVESQWAAGAALRLYPFAFSKDEKYLMVLSAGGIPRVFPIGSATGTEAEVSYSAGAADTYMAAGSPTAHDYRFATKEFFILIANSKQRIEGSNVGRAILATTMPHNLKREGKSPLRFSLNVTSWTTSPGTLANNPLPNVFWDNGATNKTNTTTSYYIDDMIIFRGRLFLGCGTAGIFSQAGTFYNFYLSASAPTVNDDDPIQVEMPGKTTHTIDRVIGMNRSLVVFTKTGRQFEFSSAETLTPGSGSFTESTAYTLRPGVAPAVIGNSIVFASSKRTSGVIYQYPYNDSQVTKASEDVSAHVEGLLPIDLFRVATSPNDGMTFALAASTPTTLYVHREEWIGGNRVQSAWTKWTFSGVSRICDIAVVDSTLYMLNETETSAQFVLESMKLGSLNATATQSLDEGAGYSNAADVTDYASE